MRIKMDEDKRLEIKQSIINCGIQIVETESFNALSIRKVAMLSGYTPGNIYQYFENKDELIREIVKFGYMKILRSISVAMDDVDSVEVKIRNIFISYTNTALSMPAYYKAVMLSEDPKLLEITSILAKELDSSKKAIILLEGLLNKGIERGEFKDVDCSIYSKLIWTSIFGLIIRLIIENQDDKEMQNKLIQSNLDLLFSGLRV